MTRGTATAGTSCTSFVSVGRHRVMQADARDGSAARKLFGRSRAALVVTSPPYFNQRDYCAWKNYADYLADVARVADAIADVSGTPFACCWNVSDSVKDHVDIPADHSQIFTRRGFTYRDKIAWVKPQPAYSVPRYRHIDRARYFPALRWEPLLVFTLAGHPRFERSDIPFWKSNISNVWEIPPVVGSAQKKIGHPAVFPLELARRCIRAYSRRGDVVFDPFLGSGTTLVAAQQLGRRCYGMDIHARYIAIALARCRRERIAMGVR